MNLKRIGLSVALAAAGFCLFSCIPLGGWEYEFINETSHTINISLDEKYKLSKETSAEAVSSSLVLYAKSSSTIYVEADVVKFTWNSSYNRDIYVVEDGPTVTFKSNEEN
jgi:hypothetical protein